MQSVSEEAILRDRFLREFWDEWITMFPVESFFHTLSGTDDAPVSIIVLIYINRLHRYYSVAEVI